MTFWRRNRHHQVTLFADAHSHALSLQLEPLRTWNDILVLWQILFNFSEFSWTHTHLNLLNQAWGCLRIWGAHQCVPFRLDVNALASHMCAHISTHTHTFDRFLPHQPLLHLLCQSRRSWTWVRWLQPQLIWILHHLSRTLLQSGWQGSGDLDWSTQPG